MKRWLAALAIAGCSQADEGGPRKLTDAAVLGAVSEGHRYLAWYTGAKTLASGQPSGTLTVAELGKTGVIPIADAAYAATFTRTGQVLLYGTDPTATDSPSVLAGRLHVWTPTISSAVRITDGYAARLGVSTDGAIVLVWDRPSATRQEPGRVLLVRTAECAAGACAPVELTAGAVFSGGGGLVLSNDGRFGAFLKSGGTGRVETWLVATAEGRATKVAETYAAMMTVPPPVAISPDGRLLATTTNAGALPLQLTVIDTATGTPVAWAKQPMNTGSIQLGFADNATLVMHAASLAGSQGVWKVTASAAAKVAPEATLFDLQRFPDGAGRWLSVMRGDAMSGYATQVYDLQAATPVGIPLSQKGGPVPLFSDDGKAVRFFESWDASARTGSLAVATLPSGTVTTVGQGVSALSAGFAEGTSKLLWVDKPDLTGAGTLSMWSDGQVKAIEKGVHNFRERAGPDTLYYAITVPGERAAGIWSRALP